MRGSGGWLENLTGLTRSMRGIALARAKAAERKQPPETCQVSADQDRMTSVSAPTRCQAGQVGDRCPASPGRSSRRPARCPGSSGNGPRRNSGSRRGSAPPGRSATPRPAGAFSCAVWESSHPAPRLSENPQVLLSSMESPCVDDRCGRTPLAYSAKKLAGAALSLSKCLLPRPAPWQTLHFSRPRGDKL
jgi:hypothetical protein